MVKENNKSNNKNQTKKPNGLIKNQKTQTKINPPKPPNQEQEQEKPQ